MEDSRIVRDKGRSRKYIDKTIKRDLEVSGLYLYLINDK